MWLITIEAVPDPDRRPDDAKEFGGAFVNCWIDYLIEDASEEIAKFFIKQNGWIPLEITEENSWFEKEDCENDEQLGFFMEAKEDGAVLVWHYYPLVDEADDEDFDEISAKSIEKKLRNTNH